MDMYGSLISLRLSLITCFQVQVFACDHTWGDAAQGPIMSCRCDAVWNARELCIAVMLPRDHLGCHKARVVCIYISGGKICIWVNTKTTAVI